MYVVESEGFRWLVRPGTDDHLGPGHENWLTSVMWVPTGGVFVDVGAHVGHFAVRLSKTAKAVYAFEPGDVQFKGLAKNLMLNNIDNVHMVKAGITNKNGFISVKVPQGGGNGQMQIEPNEGGTILGYSLDYYFITQQQPDRIDLIKIDVQGHEAKVLEGMHKVAAHYKPRLVVELHDKEFHDPSIWEGVQKELAAMNYTWTKIGEYGTNWWIEARPQ